MSISVAICDDGEEDIKLLSALLHSYNLALEINVFTDGEDLLDSFQNSEFSADILLLDIYMPGIDGISLAQKIRNYNKNLIIIFISSSREHYPQAYELFAFNYIVKPVEKAQLYNVLDRAIESLGKESEHKFSFTYKSSMYSIYYHDILYFESSDKLILIHLINGTLSQCYGKLDAIEKELPENSFLRCHNSFIVNLQHVTEMGGNYFRLGSVLISISKKYTKPSRNRYYTYLFAGMSGGRQ